MILHVFCDGGARGNPGPGAVGVVIKDEEGKITQMLSKYIGVVTNNVAEYKAVIEALSFLVASKKSYSKLYFYLDSQLVVSQLNGVFKIKEPNLRLLSMQVRVKEAMVGGNVMYKYIPREQNQEADKLVNRALDD